MGGCKGSKHAQEPPPPQQPTPQATLPPIAPASAPQPQRPVLNTTNDLVPLELRERKATAAQQLKCLGFQHNVPVLLIPGWMGSALAVEASTVEPAWIGKRVWPGLADIGLSNINWAQPTVEEADIRRRDLWAQHLRLGSDLATDPPGIRVRPVRGVPGVEPFTTATRFAALEPLIQALRDVGYVIGRDLEAAPYDWRLPLPLLEARDSYFTGLMNQAEGLSQDGKLPVAIVAHGLGAKVAHYFLGWVARRSNGREWLARNIHSFVALSAPFLGQPSTLRGLVLGGGPPGLFGFEYGVFTADEALAVTRTFGSQLCLLPMDAGAPFAYMRAQGVLHIKVERVTLHSPSISRVYLELLAGTSNRRLRTADLHAGATVRVNQEFAIVTEDGQRLTATDKFTVALHVAVDADPELLMADAVTARLGSCLVDPAQVLQPVNGDRRSVSLALVDDRGSPVGAVWMSAWFRAASGATSQRRPPANLPALWSDPKDASSQWHSIDLPGSGSLQPLHVEDVLDREGLSTALAQWHKHVLENPLHGSLDSAATGALPAALAVPPVARVLCVFGINRSTERAYLLRNRAGVNPADSNPASATRTQLALETSGVPGWDCSNGAVLEKPLAVSGAFDVEALSRRAVSGDGLVPYASLKFPFTWKRQSTEIDVKLTELDGVGHTELLASPAAHLAILKHVAAPPTHLLHVWVTSAHGIASRAGAQQRVHCITEYSTLAFKTASASSTASAPATPSPSNSPSATTSSYQWSDGNFMRFGVQYTRAAPNEELVSLSLWADAQPAPLFLGSAALTPFLIGATPGDAKEVQLTLRAQPHDSFTDVTGTLVAWVQLSNPPQGVTLDDIQLL
eukprot:TRINITY_DN2904_c0_g1_i1.p1 TRINITY_DN2904_c0_g1~~TRINITY_DN2904_c0_g1_i1.p1  ORF type:complete len:853 (+),score=115.42 TRINITY_DN2904_c0_g1_i1:60-2618(+)